MTIRTVVFDIVFSVLNPAARLLLILSLVLFMYGAAQLVLRTGGGSPADVKKGRDAVVWGIIGLAVLVSVWGLVNILINTFPGMQSNVLHAIPK